MTALVFLGLLLSLPSMGCLKNDILRLNIKKEPHLDPNTVCKTYPELSQTQYDLCRKYPDVTASAIQGVQIGIHECQHQLRSHRWNCSSLERKNKNPHASPLLKRGFKETAFAYAISAAGVTHQVSKACSLGKLKSCGCDMSVYGVNRDFEWGGCSHNVDFGEQYAKRFMDSKEMARDIHSRINLHNNRAGRLAVIHNVQKQCKCHGMSGSCELKTCWKAAPNFREVGDLLKRKFQAATKVQIHIGNAASGRLIKQNGRRPRQSDLLYYQRSPSFCEPNNRLDSPGTTGRLCNKSSDGVDNCGTLCCGRGYNILKVRRSERCNCKFYWCCYVECQTCTYNEWVTVCK
ncbi:protein Wnt-10a-like isoform X1 [Haliotis rufescens]|uniref:protein Wnt-10a-like isoform X1 n=1 Tax=Haliotis rufescens TaxID=6454 RepID=UPI001EB076C9|nr:protein Wnt-10a-like isoform X1 [Haliotis rufescens]XP_046377178.1 protein Wnt-10a-like isoform X1 [Haliotis rufescens]XP_048237735.1 protein Wnt-10a-like isoform X1 [Haliotis rufescens]